MALDEHGRELEIRYGVVLRGGAGATGDLPYGVRERALASYRHFLADEDSFDVDCNATNVVRRTFVPGLYTVTGVASTYGASVPVDLAPNSVAQVDLALANGG